MSAHDTRQTILDAAETLFAEHGYAATSMRQLTAAAGVNLAAVSYHFGGKEELTKAVLARRIEPINAARLQRLAALPSDRATVREILRAFVEPPLRAVGQRDANGAGDAQAACRMWGRISMEQPPFLRDFLQAQFGNVAGRFLAALKAASPDLDVATVTWRLHFAVGAMAHAVQNAPTISHMTHGLCDPQDTDVLVEQLVSFLAAGFAAPARPMAKKSAGAPRSKARGTGRTARSRSRS